MYILNTYWDISVISIQRIVYLINRTNVNKNIPLNIVELGGAHGQLAFLILSNLLNQKEFFPKGFEII